MKDKLTKHNKKSGHFFFQKFFLGISIIFLTGLSIAVPVTMAVYRNQNSTVLLNKTDKIDSKASNEQDIEKTEEK